MLMVPGILWCRFPMCQAGNAAEEIRLEYIKKSLFKIPDV